ncbi:uncharacterized protein VTP21DRAFT_6807 [Calcarisporiella thermophila]|uniref:uncharacterized protein n=1 Tax=Calcarisporiella thermophila TaxID=911321 RepID=UPI0037424AB0
MDDLQGLSWSSNISVPKPPRHHPASTKLSAPTDHNQMRSSTPSSRGSSASLKPTQTHQPAAMSSTASSPAVGPTRTSANDDIFGSLLADQPHFRRAPTPSQSQSLNQLRAQTPQPGVASVNTESMTGPASDPWDLDLLAKPSLLSNRISPSFNQSNSTIPPAESDDPFDLSAFEKVSNPTPFSTSSTNSSTIPDDSDANPLGLLAEPASKFQQPRTTPASSPPTVTPEDTGMDELIARIVEMGFTATQAQTALAATKNGRDVEVAIDMLIQNKEAELVTSTMQKNERQQQNSSWKSPRMTTLQNSGEELNSQFSASTHYNELNEAGTYSTTSISGLWQQRERLAAQASEFGISMFNRAQTMMKQSADKVKKSIEELQQQQLQKGTRKGYPRWMQETEERYNGGSYRDELQNRAETGDYVPYRDSSSEDEIPESRKSPANLTSSNHSSKSKLTAENRTSSATRLNIFEEKESYISPARRRQVASSAPTSGRSTPLVSERPRRPPRVPIPCDPSQLSTADGHRVRGNELFKIGQFGEAEQSYALAIASLPAKHVQLVPLYNNRAAAKLKTGDNRGCVDDCSLALEIIGQDINSTELYEGVHFMDHGKKALLRRATAYENMERYEDALSDYERLIVLDPRNKSVNEGMSRCRRALKGVPEASTPSSSVPNLENNPFAEFIDSPAPAAPKPPITRTPQPSAAAKRAGQIASDAAVSRLRAHNARQEQEDVEKLQCKDIVDARIVQWRASKEKNLRALIASLETVLWEELQWRPVPMSELVTPAQVKSRYIRAISKVHPDKMGPGLTVEQKLIANGVFSALNEAWDEFRVQNGI